MVTSYGKLLVELNIVELVVSSVAVVCTCGELIKSGVSYDFMLWFYVSAVSCGITSVSYGMN